MAFEFGGINTAVKFKQQDLILENTPLWTRNSGASKHVLILTEAAMPEPQVKALATWVAQHLKGFDFDIVSSSLLKITNADIKKEGIFRFYKKKRTDFQKFIREDQTVVVTLGFALSAVTLSSDLNVECFYDYVFNDTHFYAPQTGTHVFPIDGYDRLFKLDRWWKPQDHSRMEFAKLQLARIARDYDKLRSPALVPRLQITRINSKQEFRELLESHENEFEVAWDIETSGLDYILDRIGCLTMSWDGQHGFYIPWENVDTEALTEYFGPLDAPRRIQIGQNLKFDVKFLRRNGVRTAAIHFDTLQAGNLINEMRFNGLKSLAYYCTQHGGYDFDLDEFIDTYHPATYLDIPEPILRPYATKDAILNFLVYLYLLKQIHRIDREFPPGKGHMSVHDFLYKIKMPAVNRFVEIEMAGVYVNPERWDRKAEVVGRHIERIKKILRKELGMQKNDGPRFSLEILEDEDDILDAEDFQFEDTINRQTDRRMLAYRQTEKKDKLQSTEVLGKHLESLGWENLGRAKKGHYLTGDDQLTRWEQLGHHEATTLKKLRSWLILQKTFMGKHTDHGLGWRRYIRVDAEGKSRIHPTYKSMLMDTMRNGCGDPNYQQVPSHSIGSKHFKKIFSTPDPEKYYLVSMDYASFQMRLAAIDSEDPVLYGEYKRNPGVDMHSKTAYNVFCRDSEFEVEEVEVLVDGQIRMYFGHEEVQVLRDGKKTKVPARELLGTDEIA